MSDPAEEGQLSELAHDAVEVKDLDVPDADAETLGGGVEQTINIGSQSRGAGAGKMT
jgi:hypothetical protein